MWTCVFSAIYMKMHVYLHSLQREDEGDLSSVTHLLLSVPRAQKKHHGWLWRYVAVRLTTSILIHFYQTCWNKTSHGGSLSVPTDMDIKPINKRASGQAFEVILKPSSPVSDVSHCITTPPKRDLSLEDIQKKLEAAEDRRRVSLLPITFIYPSCHGSHQLEPQKPFLTTSLN